MAKSKRKPKPKVKVTGKPPAPSEAIAWVTARERTANEQGLASRDLYASHRDRLTSLISSFAGPEKRLCLLGAGNCNDVDLTLLAEQFAEVQLVDIDERAVRGAIATQPEALRKKLTAQAPLDLSGLFGQLPYLKSLDSSGLAPPSVFAVELLKLVHSSSTELVEKLNGPFDVCVSCCMSTQISWALTELLTKSHPRLETLRLALLMVHLRLLTGLRRRGGVALWVTDVSSTSLYPILEALSVVSPSALLAQLVETGKVYSGGNPKLLERIRATEPTLADTAELEAYEPWLWKTQSRTYLVQAVRFGDRPVPTTITTATASTTAD